MAKKMMFGTCGFDSLELQMSRTILKKHDLLLEDIKPILEGYTDDELHGYMRRRTDEGTVCLMPNVPLDRMEDQPYLEKIAMLRPNDIPGGMSVLAQICAIVGHQSSRYENLVSSFATGHIRGLRAAGATEEEVMQIALRDRLARGGTLEDERLVAKQIYQLQNPQYGSALVYEVLLYHNHESVFEDATRRRSLIDYALCRAEPHELVTFCFDRLDYNYRLYQTEVYTTDWCDIRAAQRIAKAKRLVAGKPCRDARTGLHMVKLAAADRARDIDSMRELLARYRRSLW